MHIKNITVEGGFLDGLDLTFSDGLNVIIGGRGTGKTSLLELIRFCLNISRYSSEALVEDHERALAILADGIVTTTLVESDHEISITRSAFDQESRISSPFTPPLMFSQTEIEHIGLSKVSRMRLLDGFIPSKHIASEKETAKEAKIKSLTTQLLRLKQDLDSHDLKLKELPDLENELKKTLEEEKKIIEKSKEAKKLQERLDKLRGDSANYSLKENLYKKARGEIIDWKENINSLINYQPDIPDWPEQSGDVDEFKSLRSSIKKAVSNLKEIDKELSNHLEHFNTLEQNNKSERLPLDTEARELRKKIDDIEKGAGAISKKASELSAKIEQLKGLKQDKDKLNDKIKTIKAERSSLLDELDELRAHLYDKRKEIANTLNERLSPRIKVVLERGGQDEEYIDTISNTLRGSGIKYNELAPIIASNMSPRELIEACEDDDYHLISKATGVSKDRAARLANALMDAGPEDILVSKVEDNVDYFLLDGPDYKGVDSLSIGQRCTVLIPVILEHWRKMLIIDQPEDHLDNKFIVDSLIKSIKDRKQKSQTILTSHNANIPVLGDADLIIVLASDGETGYVSHTGPLKCVESVDAITSIMEGGHAAFEKRSDFYDEFKIYL